MTTVSVRELKSDLSRYLAAVREGEDVLVTDHGTPVARLTKALTAEEADGQALDGLAAKGLLRPAVAGRRPRRPRPPKLPGKPLSEMIIEDRG